MLMTRGFHAGGREIGEWQQRAPPAPTYIYITTRKAIRKTDKRMGRTKFSAKEIEEIAKLLRLKNASNRARQKQIRHDLRVDYEFNISDFNEQGKAFGETELREAVKRGAIAILDDATIADMKAKRARDKARDEEARQQEAVDSGQATDWKAAMEEWEQWEQQEITKKS